MAMDPVRYLERPIKTVKEATHLPVFAKIPVDCCDTIGTAGLAQKAGADGVVPVTRWLSITVDIDHEKDPVWRGPGIGGPWSAPIMNGLIFRMRHADQPVSYLFKDSSERFPDVPPVTVPIIPSGGIQSGAEVIGYLISGANAAEVCAQVILEGPGMAQRIEKEMRSWMARKGYKRVADFQGTLKLLEHARVKDLPQWLAVVNSDRCNGCETCIKACPNQAILLEGDVACVNPDYCEGCRTCYYICPKEAISLKE
jgi:ferredoxin